MMWRNGVSRVSLLIGLGVFSSPAFPAGFNIAAGPADTAARTLTSSETGTVQSGATLSVTGTAITWAGPSAVPGVTIDNFGQIRSGNRAIDTTNSNTPRNLTLNNHLDSVISAGDDTFRLNAAIGNGKVVVNNDGMLSSDGGQVLDFASNTSATGRVEINNGAQGVIKALADDAIRTGLGTVVINNSGLIDSTTAAKRGINLNTGNLDSVASFQVFNKAGGIIQSQDDAVRVTGSSGLTTTTGSFLLDNAGTIQTLGAGSGQAVDWRDLNSPAATVRIINRATGVIAAADTDAIRPAGNSIVENYGQIIAGGITLGSSIGGLRFSGDAIDFGTNSGKVYNYAGGLISGAKSGTASDPGGDITVYNYAGATILGRNGAGVGSGSNARIYNYGTITGAIDNTSTRSDGDGIDVDFRADVVNYGLVQGTGARGGDANGRLNNSEGVAFGGGTIANYGTISGADAGIVANNDSNTDNSRSGVAASTITNYAYGMIVGKTSYAIRLENKTGTAADNDTIVNYGTIIGNGAIPDPNAVVLINTGAVDTGTSGTLDGVTYTSTGINTGSARFIRGDGSAIQMGEGTDVLTNYGTIIGNNGRAVNLEGGNDTANIMPGSRIVGLVDGGAGTDTLNYNKIGLTEAKRGALQAGQTVNIGGTLYTSFEVVNGAAQSFSSFAASGSARGVANLFDNGSTSVGAGENFVGLIDAVASSSNVGAALSQLSPTAYQGLSAFGVTTTQQTLSQVGQQLTDTRLNGSRIDLSGAGAALAMFNEGFFSKRSGAVIPSDLPFAGFGDVGMPANAMAYAGGMAGKAVPVPDSDRGLFFNSSLSFLRQGPRADAPATRATTASFATGTDWRVSDRSIVGVFGSFARTTGDLDSLGSSTRIDTGAVGVYGMYNAPGWFATGMALHGWSGYDNRRVALGTASTSSFDGTHYALRGSLGSDRRFGQWLVTPEIGLQYVRIMLPGFAETGTAAALVVGKDDSESLRSSVGARFAYDLRLAQGTVTPEFRLAWQHEFLDGVRNLTASFTDPGFGGTFVTPTGAPVRDLGVIGAGVSGRLGPMSTVSLNYDAVIGDHDTVSHNVTGRLRHSF